MLVTDRVERSVPSKLAATAYGGDRAACRVLFELFGSIRPFTSNRIGPSTASSVGGVMVPVAGRLQGDHDIIATFAGLAYAQRVVRAYSSSEGAQCGRSR